MLYSGQWNAATTLKKARNTHCSAGIAHSARWSACSASAFDGRTAGAPAACWDSQQTGQKPARQTILRQNTARQKTARE